jgi:putative ABC transport system ATP-binding protein
MTMQTQTVVELIDVTKTYRLGEILVEALRGVNMRASGGEIVAIMGPSGSGKSTILNLIGALDRPTSGKVIIAGKDISKMSENKLGEIRRDSIGYIFQFYNLIPVLTAYENVELPMLITGVSGEKRAARAHELLGLVGLANRAHHRPDELSGGEQQRVAVARALSKRPPLVLADEPTGDLDSKSGMQVMTILKDLAKKELSTVVMVTHDHQMASLADRILELRDGKIVKETEII